MRHGLGLGNIVGGITHGVGRSIEGVTDTVSGVFEPTIRLGVTGLSRAGKTVFITSLVANLLNRGRMPQLIGASNGAILSAYLQPQPDDTIPRFDYEAHRAAMTGPDAQWPNSTRAISELRLSFRVQPAGLLSGLSGPRKVHLDIVDYPGEWLLDLGLLDKSFADWSTETLARLTKRDQGAAFTALLAETDADATFNEGTAKTLAETYTAYMHAALGVGLADLTPGRFILPGELVGSPVLTFAPLPPQAKSARTSLYREMERRYEAYKSRVVKPFFRDHFARIDRQVVLVDALGAIHKGPQAVEDLRTALSDILTAFRPGRNAFLSTLFMGRRIDKILFAATKADHLHHEQHAQLANIMDALVRDAKDRADFAGASTASMAIASLRATIEHEAKQNGMVIPAVRGKLADTGKQAAFYAGALPKDPNVILNPARDGETAWLDGDFGAMRFAPAEMELDPNDGPPHIRLDRAAEFLIGDKLR